MKKLLQRLQTPVSIFLIFLSVIWISFSLWEGRGSLFVSLSDINPILFVFSVLLAMAELAITSYIYFLILSAASGIELPVWHVMTSHLTSQAVRYLPGRVWGHLYLVQAMAGRMPALHTIKANAGHFLLAVVYSMAVAAAVLAYHLQGLVFAIAVLIPTQVFVFFMLRSSLSGRDSFRSSQSGRCFMIIALLILDWLIYFFICALLLPGHLGVSEIVAIATCYAIAWLIGAFAVISPGGLLVREASFLWLADLFGYDPAVMVAFGIAARLVFTIAEAACAVLGAGLAFKMNMIVLERGGK